MNRLSWLVAGLAIAAAVFVLILASPGATAWTSGDSCPASGDWTINNPTVVADDAITVNGNLIIKNSFEVYRSTVRINSLSDKQYMVNVTDTGTFRLYESSTLTASSVSCHYPFLVWGKLHINYSTVSEMWGDTASWAGGIQLYYGGNTIENSNIIMGKTGGIYIWNVSATVSMCNIYSNGLAGSTQYCFGIYAGDDGLGSTTSTKIDGNLIYNNYFASGTSRYGYGLYTLFLSKSDTITNNQIYDNGFSTTGSNYGYQLYLQYSNATVTDNQLRNGSCQIYAYGSGPIAFKNLNISSYARMSTSSYGVYAYNSTLSFNKCDWYAFNCAYTMYGVWANGPNINSSSSLEFNNCTFNYSMSGTYVRYLIYGNSYTRINVTDCTAYDMYGSFYGVWGASYSPANIINTKIYTNQTTATYMVRMATYSPVYIAGCSFNLTTATSTVYGIYATSYSNVTFNDSTVEFTDARTTTYFMYANSYSPITSNNVKMYGWAIGMNGAGNIYGFYGYYSTVKISNMTFMLRDCRPSYTYMGYCYNYNIQDGGLWINDSLFDDWNCRANYYHYLIYNMYGHGYYSNFKASVNRTYNMYYYYGNYAFYDYGYSNAGQTLTMLNCTINESSPGFLYNMYGYYKTPFIDNCTFNMYCTYYLYGLMTGYVNSVTIQNCIFNVDYNSSYQYGYFFYCYNYNARTQFTFYNNVIQYNTYIPGASGYATMFYVYYVDLYIINSKITIQNYNGLFPMKMFYYMYDAGVWVNGSTLTVNYGGGTGTSGVGVQVGYLQQLRNLNFTNSTMKVTTKDDPMSVDCFYFMYACPVMSFDNSRMEFYVDSPGTTVNMVSFDTANAGSLTLLSLKKSILSLTVNRAGSAVTMLKLTPTSAIKQFVLQESEVQVNLLVNTQSPIFGVQMVGVKDLTLKDLALKLTAPAGDSEMVGVQLEKSSPWLDNITVTGNGQGRIRGIRCDLASAPTISNCRITGAYSGICSVFFSRPLISNVDLSGCLEGITVDSNGNGTVSGCNINGTQTGARLLEGSWLNLIDSTFTNNTLDIRLDGTSTAWLLNTGFTRAGVQFDDDFSALVVNWWLQLKIMWQNKDGLDSGNVIPSAEVVMTDSFGTEFLRTVATEEGVVPWFTVPEYIETDLAKTSYSPYKVSVTYKGFSGSDTLTVDKTKEHIINIIDDATPLIEITEPADGTIQNFREIILRGAASDLGSGLDRLSFSFDGINWEEGPATALWEHLMAPPEGSYTLTVKVSDLAGNGNSASIGVRIDLTAPFILVSSPANNSLGNSIGVDLAGSVEPGSELTVNHRPVAVGSDGRFTYGLRLVEGINSFSLFARDRAGNTNATTWTLLLDITPPPLLLTAPVDGLLTNQKTVRVAGKTEPGAGAKVNGADITLLPDGSFAFQFNLTSGTNIITVVASDIAGNNASRMRTVILDDEIRLALDYPEEDLVTNQITILARGTTDTDVLLRMNEGLVTVGPDGKFSVTYTLEEGLNELRFSAFDRAGNTIEVTRIVILDTLRPALEITSPAPDVILRSRDVTVSGSCEPGITLTVNGETVPTETGVISKTLTLPEGASIITIEGRDRAGNLVSVQIPVLIDLTAPSLEIVEPFTGFRTRDLTVIVVGITEPGTRVMVNDMPVVVDPFGKFSTTVTLQKGSNGIKVTASDDAGNSAERALTVKVTTPPGAAAENTWWWTASGLLLALGIMIPLTALLVTMSLRMRRRSMEGSK